MGMENAEPKKDHQFHVPKPAGPPKKAGQYDPAPWDDYFDSMEKLDGVVPCYYAGSEGHVFLCLHGAGHSALSFAMLAKILKGKPHNSTCVAFDFRGHGQHYCENEAMLTQQILINDTIIVIKQISKKYPDQSIVLVGHSMGGSIACKTMDFINKNHKDEDWADHIKGLFIIDVVEGSAMDALPFMESIVKTRPSKFDSLQSVIKYGVTSNTVRDVRSARVSMPA